MKIAVKNEKYKFITDNSADLAPDSCFCLTEHNKKYLPEAKKITSHFTTPTDLFKKWKLTEIKIIGITGTNGKTTSANLIAHLLKSLGEKVFLSGTEGVFLFSPRKIKKLSPRTNTTPEILTTLFNLKQAREAGAKFFIMEVSSHGIFQKRIEGLKFAVKLFTNLSQDHLDFHKNMKEYARVKSSFFQDESRKVINADDDWIKFNSKHSLKYSLNKEADLMAENLNFQNGIKATLIFKNKKYQLKSKLMGKFNLYNILGAVGVLIQLNKFKINDILKKVKTFSGVAGRMEVLYKDKKLNIFSDYAHTPDAIENVLQSLNRSAKIFTIIGAGGDRDKSKRAPMAKIACQNSDWVILTSDNPRHENPKNILADMKKGVKNKFQNYEIIINRSQALKKIIKKSKQKKYQAEKIIIAILGKGDENYLDIKGKKIPYSDKEEVIKIIF